MNDIVCPISQKSMKPIFAETILNKYLVTYYYCEESGLLKTETAYWLDEAYISPIANTDTGILQRNIYNSLFLEVLLGNLFKGEGKFLDISGGYGILARLMRDKGFDFYTTDKYCSNIFANNFEPEIGFKANALCAFEVLEHIENPKLFLSNTLEEFNCRTLIFSTETFLNDQIPDKSWQYYSFETGQHITFYQPRTLQLLADSLQLSYYMINPSMHLITDLKLSPTLRYIISKYKLLKILSLCFEFKFPNKSKSLDDHIYISKGLKKSR
ncbi:class I SAM-dependent methyltransferase [Pseudanabaena sp. FACHB-1998]|uniref:class I SAM-dependent methyltransferase n=1 Tax=Pseudanabaena sp. FACHB-1998 TaxID=2692858 RepID=UPI001680330C|nr:class I SAM-dependent methyltransferase [Pseudanabaena sp. FACHB-1998]MBD2178845.1 class I SAM-dependent methyltransferase [Pseudanabaena sp. FACHB-1998]